MARSRTAVMLLVVLAGACAAESELGPPPPPPPPPPSTGTPPPAQPLQAGQQATPGAPARAPMAELQKRAIASYVAAFNAHDAKKLAETYRADAVVVSPGPQQMSELRGREAIDKSHQGLFASVADIKMANERVIQVGDIVVQQWASSGTHKTDSMGVKATNRPMGIRGLTIFWFEQDGLVRRDHTYYDSATIAVQIGATKGRARQPPTLPAGEPEWVSATGAADEAKNVEAVKAAWAAVEKKDEKAMVDVYADDVAVVNLNEADDRKTKKSLKEALGALGRALPDLRLSPQNIWGAGNYVIAEGVMSGTHKGQLGPFKATNKPIAVHFIDVFQFKDGKIVQATSYASNLEMLAQLGSPPEPKPAAKPADGSKPKAEPKKDPSAKPAEPKKDAPKPAAAGTSAPKTEPAKPKPSATPTTTPAASPPKK